MNKFVLSFPKSGKAKEKSETSSKTQNSSSTSTQMYLDFGQKSFGKRKTCSNCGMVFVLGHKEDEMKHKRFCTKESEIKLPSISGHDVISKTKNGIIIKGISSHKSMLDRIISKVQEELGSSDSFISLTSDNRHLFYFYLTLDYKIVGFLLVEKVPCSRLVSITSYEDISQTLVPQLPTADDHMYGTHASSSFSSSSSSSISSSSALLTYGSHKTQNKMNKKSRMKSDEDYTSPPTTSLPPSSSSSSSSFIDASEIGHETRPVLSHSSSSSPSSPLIPSILPGSDSLSLESALDEESPPPLPSPNPPPSCSSVAPSSSSKLEDPSPSSSPSPPPSLLKQSTYTLGVRQIWVSPSHRRLSLASQLVDTARMTWEYGGEILPREEVAFSQPTFEGWSFSRQYIGGRGRVWVYG